ncbi:MAG: ribbon-helix-helix protein, CopG family [Coriobacteriia bacterium]|nr:ribbon-helix-helix protein, CopG family [Coriobacteriia bacterium]
MNVYIADDLLERVDAEAHALDRSRSSVVQEALAEYVTSRAETARREAVTRAIDVAEGIADDWPSRDAHPEIFASEYLIGLRAADEGDADADVVLRIVSERGRPGSG